MRFRLAAHPPRIVTALLALVFALLSVIAPALHTHAAQKSGGATRHAAYATHLAHQTATVTDPADCAVCDWLLNTVGNTPSPQPALASPHTQVSLLTLATRRAALCARPLPRRGLRAPPSVS